MSYCVIAEDIVSASLSVRTGLSGVRTGGFFLSKKPTPLQTGHSVVDLIS